MDLDLLISRRNAAGIKSDLAAKKASLQRLVRGLGNVSGANEELKDRQAEIANLEQDLHEALFG